MGSFFSSLLLSVFITSAKIVGCPHRRSRPLCRHLRFHQLRPRFHVLTLPRGGVDAGTLDPSMKPNKNVNVKGFSALLVRRKYCRSKHCMKIYHSTSGRSDCTILMKAPDSARLPVSLRSVQKESGYVAVHVQIKCTIKFIKSTKAKVRDSLVRRL